jgi:hypothetical protein
MFSRTINQLRKITAAKRQKLRAKCEGEKTNERYSIGSTTPIERGKEGVKKRESRETNVKHKRKIEG